MLDLGRPSFERSIAAGSASNPAGVRSRRGIGTSSELMDALHSNLDGGSRIPSTCPHRDRSVLNNYRRTGSYPQHVAQDSEQKEHPGNQRKCLLTHINLSLFPAFVETSSSPVAPLRLTQISRATNRPSGQRLNVLMFSRSYGSEVRSNPARAFAVR